MFAEAGLPPVHRPGLAVSHTRRGIRAGERTPDPKDAAVIAEFIALLGPIDRFDSADAVSVAAGLAPVLRQPGKTSVVRRVAGGDKALRRVFYRAAFTSPDRPGSRAFHDRDHDEGKRHHKAVIALARRCAYVLWATLENRTPVRENVEMAA